MLAVRTKVSKASANGFVFVHLSYLSFSSTVPKARRKAIHLQKLTEIFTFLPFCSLPLIFTIVHNSIE